MKYLLRSGCKSTFVALMVVAFSNVAMAQFGGHARGSDRMPRGIDNVIKNNSGRLIKGDTGNIGSSENLYQTMKSQHVPPTIHVEDLTTDWHIIQVTPFGIPYFADADSSGILNYAYFTHGDVFTFGKQKYLVVYHIQLPSDAEKRTAKNYGPSSSGPVTVSRQSTRINPVLYKNTTLALSLLPINQSQSFHEIKAFDPKTDITELPPKVDLNKTVSKANLKQIALGVLMYAQDYDEKFPPMIAARGTNQIMRPVYHGNESVESVQTRLEPYVKSSKVFLQPVTHRPYLPNYKISRHSMADVKNAASTFLFYEDAPDADGMRNVAYVDGHVKALPEAEFQRQRKAQGISESGYPSAAKITQKAKVTPKP